MTMLRKTLMLGAVLAVMAGATAHAQDASAPVAGAAPVAAPAPSSSTDLPFINNGANQPVLQTISPDGQAIAPDAMVAPAPEGAEHAAEGGEHKKGLPQFDTTTFSKQLFWLALTFVFLFFMYSKVTLPRISSVIENRASKVAKDLATAEQLKTDVERVRAEYEAAIAAAQSEAQKLIANVQSDIKRMSETQDAAFKAKAEEAVTTVEKKIDASRARIVGELNALAAELTVDIAARVAGVKTDANAAQGIISGISDKAKAA